MPQRDPNKTAKNKLITNLSQQLNKLLPEVLYETGISSIGSLHGIYGGKFVDYMNTRTDIIRSPEEFISKYMTGLMQKSKNSASAQRNLRLINKSPSLKKYLYLFLARVYYRQSEALGRIRPYNDENAVIWFGQENQNYGIFITPRFNQNKNQWENDGSEIKFFPKLYWTIGHVLHTGLKIPNQNSSINFTDVNQYLDFFLGVLVRASGSKYELDLAQFYCNYVRKSNRQEDIPLLIPEYRYDGIQKKHKYRLDFTLINPYNLQRFGFELSPWSTHGRLTGTNKLTQKEINQNAQENFENEMRKQKDFFRKHNIFIRIYTDSDLKNMNNIFTNDIIPLLESQDLFYSADYEIITNLLS